MTTINTVRYAAITLLFLLGGCSHRVPQATVEVIDTSLSITPRAEKAALDAVQNQIAHMHRGDILVLIPITGDAANDAGGRILCLSAPTQRETYDTDLRRFHEQARKQFATWIASLDEHQSRTDILGALDAARQEFAAIPNGMNRKLVVVRHLPFRIGPLAHESGVRPPTCCPSPRAARLYAARRTSLSWPS